MIAFFLNLKRSFHNNVRIQAIGRSSGYMDTAEPAVVVTAVLDLQIGPAVIAELAGSKVK